MRTNHIYNANQRTYRITIIDKAPREASVDRCLKRPLIKLILSINFENLKHTEGN